MCHPKSKAKFTQKKDNLTIKSTYRQTREMWERVGRATVILDLSANEIIRRALVAFLKKNKV